MAFSPNGGLLANGTAIFSVSASGAPTPVGGTPPDPSATAVAFSPSGTLLAAANNSSDTISMFSVGSSGALTSVSGSPFSLGAPPTSVVFSPSGELLAVTAGTEASQSLYMFSVSASGALTLVPGSPYGVSTAHVAFSPTGALLAAQVTTGVRMFSVSSAGALTEVPGSPFPETSLTGGAGSAPKGVVFRPNGTLLVSFFDGGSVQAERITTYTVASSGALTLLGSGVGPVGAPPSGPSAFSPDGSMVAGARWESAGVQVLSVGPSGALSVLPGSPFPTPVEARAIAFSANGLLAATGLSVLVPSSTSAGTSWVGALGSEGYDLAGWDGETDVSNSPNAAVSLVKGSRCQWAANTSDVHALTSPDGLTRTAGGYCDPTEVQVKLTFHAAYTGDVRLYAVAWENGASKYHETVTIGSAAFGFSDNSMMGSWGFNEGQWAISPVSEPAGGSLIITAKVEPGWPRAVLSGIFLGDAGAPPATPVSTSPQGTWTGAVGSSGYDLAAWGASSDVSYLPNASLSLTQGSRYEWASSTEDPRALQRPGRPHPRRRHLLRPEPDSPFAEVQLGLHRRPAPLCPGLGLDRKAS